MAAFDPLRTFAELDDLARYQLQIAIEQGSDIGTDAIGELIHQSQSLRIVIIIGLQDELAVFESASNISMVTPMLSKLGLDVQRRLLPFGSWNARAL
jgi:hypothetical protein